MANKKTEKAKRKQIDMDLDLVDMAVEIVGHKKGAVSDLFNNILRPILIEKHREALISKVRKANITPEEIKRKRE